MQVTEVFLNFKILEQHALVHYKKMCSFNKTIVKKDVKSKVVAVMVG